MKISRILFFLSLGLLWAPVVALMSNMTSQIGVIPYGDTMFATRATGALGDLLNIGLASLLLAFVVAGIGRAKWWEISLAVLPALIWSLVDFAYYPSLPGTAWVTAALYLLFLVTVPFVLVKTIGNRLAASSI